MPNNVPGLPPAYPGQPQSFYSPQQTFPLQPSNSHGALHLAHQQSMQQAGYLPPMQQTHPMFNSQMQPNSMSFSMYEPNQMNGDILSPQMMHGMTNDPYGMQQQNNANSFRLHQFVSFNY